MDSQKNHNISPIFLFLRPLIVLTILITLGTIGYMRIEGWNLLDALFMSIQTLTTVGFGFVHPLSNTGRIFTLIYILFGVILFLYLAAEFAKYVVTVNFGRILSRKNMEAKLKKIKDHYIICGYGRTGAEIAAQLKSSHCDFVVIDKNPDVERIALDMGFLFVIGDATDDITLQQANIEKAKGLFCALCDDVDNLYLTVSAKGLNSDLVIVARCVKASNEQKLLKAGATNVILPFEISGRRMVASVIKPLVVDFLDVVMHTKGHEIELKMEQFMLSEDSDLVGKTILSSELRQKTGIIIVAIKRGDKFITNPSPDTILKANDYLISLGTSSQLANFEKIVA